LVKQPALPRGGAGFSLLVCEFVGIAEMDVVFLLKVLKALAEVAGFALLGQGLVYLFAGINREKNFVYVLLRIITSPATKLARLLSPRFVRDQHMPLVAFGLVFWVWVATVVGLIYFKEAPI
jgi:hypothetical protein